MEVGLSPFIRLKQTYKVFSAFCSGPRAGGEKKNGGGNFFGEEDERRQESPDKSGGHTHAMLHGQPHTHIAGIRRYGGILGDNACNAAHLLFLCNKPRQIASCLALFVAAHSPSLNLNDILTPFP